MAVYTSFDMIEDCRRNRPEGWTYFVRHYAAAALAFARRYRPERAGDPVALVAGLARADSPLFAAGLPERDFVAELRQRVLEGEPAEWTLAFDFAEFARRLEPFTVIEKQAVWLETMRYDVAAAGAMLKMLPESVERVRSKAAELVGPLAGHACAFARATAAVRTEKCPPSAALLDYIDGRLTWTAREEVEGHVNSCWHSVDHLCRLREAAELLRSTAPLSDAECAPYLEALGITAARRPLWKRLIAGA